MGWIANHILYKHDKLKSHFVIPSLVKWSSFPPLATSPDGKRSLSFQRHFTLGLCAKRSKWKVEHLMQSWQGFLSFPWYLSWAAKTWPLKGTPGQEPHGRISLSRSSYFHLWCTCRPDAATMWYTTVEKLSFLGVRVVSCIKHHV